MPRFRYHDDDSSSAGTVVGVLVGAVAGFAVGMLVAQRVGGISGLRSKLRRGRGRSTDEAQLGEAHGVAGVDAVVNRIVVGEEEERFADTAQRFRDGDPALNEARWEGQRVGTGRRRQGTSEEPDRHADPKVDLQQRWLREDENLGTGAEETEAAEKRRPGNRMPSRGDRAVAASLAP